MTTRQIHLAHDPGSVNTTMDGLVWENNLPNKFIKSLV